MLKQYGPNVPEGTLKKLVAAFAELRHMSDDGTIAYPYSTREVVNIVKHLEVSINVDNPLFKLTAILEYCILNVLTKKFCM